MWLWRSLPRGDTEGAKHGFRANLSGKRTEFDDTNTRWVTVYPVPFVYVLQSQIIFYGLAFRFAAIDKEKDLC